MTDYDNTLWRGLSLGALAACCIMAAAAGIAELGARAGLVQQPPRLTTSADYWKAVADSANAAFDDQFRECQRLRDENRKLRERPRCTCGAECNCWAGEGCGAECAFQK